MLRLFPFHRRWRPAPVNSLTTTLVMPPKKTMVPEAVLAPLDTNQVESFYEKPEARKGRLLAQPHKMRSWIKRLTTLKPYTNKWRRGEKKCFGFWVAKED